MEALPQANNTLIISPLLASVYVLVINSFPNVYIDLTIEQVNQTIGVATEYSDEIGFPPDGTLGMAFPSLSSNSASPFFKTLIDEGKVIEPVFSVKVTSVGGELYLGGKNGKLYEGEIIYTPVTEVVSKLKW
jgi:hypothetical protein